MMLEKSRLNLLQVADPRSGARLCEAQPHGNKG